MRLDKYLADMGLGTRSEIKKEIKAGHVTVDGELIRDPGYNKVTADCNVEYCGSPVSYEEYVYYGCIITI
jgi:16S rRNA pseudouridine516 synthase